MTIEQRLARLEQQMVALKEAVSDVLYQVAVRGGIPLEVNDALVKHIRAAFEDPPRPP